jgi:hypothetical protein
MCSANAKHDANVMVIIGRPRDGLYEPVLADSEREAVADLLQYLENVCILDSTRYSLLLTGFSGARQTSSPASRFELSALLFSPTTSTCSEAQA